MTDESDPEQPSVVKQQTREVAEGLAAIFERVVERLREYADDGWPRYECACASAYRHPPDVDHHECPKCGRLVVK